MSLNNHCFSDCGRNLRGPYLTAYQIALKYGFRGTEAQWIKAIGTMRIIQVTDVSGTSFECNASLGQIRQYLEDGFLPVLVHDGIPAFVSDIADSYVAFSTQVLKTAEGDVYDVYTISGREQTVETMTVSGSGGGGIGPGVVGFNNLAEDVLDAIGLAGTAVQPEDLIGLVRRDRQASRTEGYTQEVAADANGKLWVPASQGVSKLTVTFTNEQNGWSSDVNLSAVLQALRDGKLVDCMMGDYHGELVFAHDEGEDGVSGEEYAIFKITEYIISYQGQDGEERYPQVDMIFLNHVGPVVKSVAVGGSCYVYITKQNGDYMVDTANTSKTAQSITGLVTAFYAGVETRLIYVDGNYRYSHPVSFHYGTSLIRFSGPENYRENNVDKTAVVTYTLQVGSPYVTREVFGEITTAQIDDIIAGIE